MLKIHSFLMVVSSIIIFDVNATLPIYPAEIIGRDLSFKGAGWTGHVGITTAPNLGEDAYQVIEVLWEDPVIQINTIANFKTRTPYWGSRYGISDRGNSALRILREANFQKDLGCSTYTLTNDYDVSRGGYDGTKPHPTHCGYFRCDTFVNYVFHWGGYTLPTYNPPKSPHNASIPRYVFNAFPKGNGDGPLAPELTQAFNSDVLPPNDKSSTQTSINAIAAEPLVTMSLEEFFNVIDVPPNDITKDGVVNLLKLSKNPTLSPEKRAFLVDKLGFVGTADMIPAFITLYGQLNNDDDFLIKRQVIATSMHIYQRYSMLDQYPQEKKLLQDFYLSHLDDELLATEKSIIIRGLISLSSSEYIIANLNKIMSKINDSKNKLSPQTSLKLKMELLNISPKLESILVPDIINTLQFENNSELDGIFNAFIVYRLSHQGPNSLMQQSKNEISTYLNSIKFKYDAANKFITDDGITLFSYGSWLEASALINSNQLKSAAKYIAKYLQNRNADEQKTYVIGLSSSRYMKNAFNTEPVLEDFKKANKSIYINSVGTQKN